MHCAAALDHEAGDRLVAQAGAGDQGVADVAVGGVVPGQHGGDAALGPAAGAVEQLLLGDQTDLALVGQMQRQRQPGQAAADDQNVETVCHELSLKVGDSSGMLTATRLSAKSP